MSDERPTLRQRVGAFVMPPVRPVPLRVDDPLHSLWSASCAFRLVTLAYAWMVHATSVGFYIRPGMAWALLGLQTVWSGLVALVLVMLPRWRLGAVVVDQLVTAALMFSTWWVAPQSWWDHNQSLPTTIWVCNAIVTAAIYGGVTWGLLSGIAMALISLRVGGDWGWMAHSPTIPVLASVGISLGAASRGARRSARQLALAYEIRARVAERERLARQVHDGALQVLALTARYGAQGDATAQELGRLAAEQERALRELIATRDETDDLASPVWGGGSQGRRRPSRRNRVGHSSEVSPENAPEMADVRAQLLELASTNVHVSAGADSVWLPNDRADELIAAVRQAVTNTRQHAPGATSYVLLEDVGDDIVVTVRDDGPGIPDGRLAQARADGHIGVSGSIVARLRDVGGEAVLETAPDEGVEWELTLPKIAPTPKS